MRRRQRARMGTTRIILMPARRMGFMGRVGLLADCLSAPDRGMAGDGAMADTGVVVDFTDVEAGATAVAVTAMVGEVTVTAVALQAVGMPAVAPGDSGALLAVAASTVEAACAAVADSTAAVVGSTVVVAAMAAGTDNGV